MYFKLERRVDVILCSLSPRFKAWRSKYEWHPDDPMDLGSIILWHMCQSKIKPIRRWGQRKWDV